MLPVRRRTRLISIADWLPKVPERSTSIMDAGGGAAITRSKKLTFDFLAKEVPQQAVHLLNARRFGAGNRDHQVGYIAHSPAGGAGKHRGENPAFPRFGETQHDIAAVAGRGKTNGEIAGMSERFDLPGEERARSRNRCRRPSARRRRTPAPARPARAGCRTNRTVSSAARCCASAALPPFPKNRIFPPPVRLATVFSISCSSPARHAASVSARTRACSRMDSLEAFSSHACAFHEDHTSHAPAPVK